MERCTDPHFVNQLRFSKGFYTNEKRDKRDQIQFIVYNSYKALAALLGTKRAGHTCVGWCKKEQEAYKYFMVSFPCNFCQNVKWIKLNWLENHLSKSKPYSGQFTPLPSTAPLLLQLGALLWWAVQIYQIQPMVGSDDIYGGYKTKTPLWVGWLETGNNFKVGPKQQSVEKGAGVLLNPLVQPKSPSWVCAKSYYRVERALGP